MGRPRIHPIGYKRFKTKEIPGVSRIIKLHGKTIDLSIQESLLVFLLRDKKRPMRVQKARIQLERLLQTSRGRSDIRTGANGKSPNSFSRLLHEAQIKMPDAIMCTGATRQREIQWVAD